MRAPTLNLFTLFISFTSTTSTEQEAQRLDIGKVSDAFQKTAIAGLNVWKQKMNSEEVSGMGWENVSECISKFINEHKKDENDTRNFIEMIYDDIHQFFGSCEASEESVTKIKALVDDVFIQLVKKSEEAIEYFTRNNVIETSSQSQNEADLEDSSLWNSVLRKLYCMYLIFDYNQDTAQKDLSTHLKLESEFDILFIVANFVFGHVQIAEEGAIGHFTRPRSDMRDLIDANLLDLFLKEGRERTSFVDYFICNFDKMLNIIEDKTVFDFELCEAEDALLLLNNLLNMPSSV